MNCKVERNSPVRPSPILVCQLYVLNSSVDVSMVSSKPGILLLGLEKYLSLLFAWPSLMHYPDAVLAVV